MNSIHLLPQKRRYSVLNRSHINMCSVIPCGITTFLEQNLNAISSFFRSCFFYQKNNSVDKAPVLSLSTSVCLAVVFFSIFFVSPAFAVDALTTTQNVTASPDVTASIFKVTGGLLLVIVAIFGSAWFFRRFGNFSPVANDSLRVIGGLTMGQKEKIVLLQVGEEQVLIGVAPGNIQKLHVLEKPIKLNEGATKDNNVFANQLSDALGKLKKK